MPKKLIIPNREASYTDEQYTNIVRQSIKEQRPYLDDEELSSLATFKMGSVVAPPKVAEKPKTFTQLAKSIKAEKPQPFKSTTEMVDKFVPKQEVTTKVATPQISKEQAAQIKSPFTSNLVGQENFDKQKAFNYANELPPTLADPNQAAATARMLEKFIPTQPKEAPMELVGKDFAPEAPRQASALNKIAPNVQQVTENAPIQVQPSSGKRDESIKEYILGKQTPIRKDEFDVEAEMQIPQGSANEKLVFAETLRQNNEKLKQNEAIKVSSEISDDDFNKAIQRDFIEKQDRGFVLEQKYGGFKDEINKSIREYMETPQFKPDVVRISKEQGVTLNQAAQIALDQKSLEYANAPSALEAKMQKFSDWAATNDIPFDYTAAKTATAGLKGLTDVGAFIGATLQATKNSLDNVTEGNDFNFGNEFARRNAAMQRQSRVMIPQVQSDKASPFTQGISDVTSMVAAIGVPMAVAPQVNMFTKAKNILSFGRGGEKALQQGLSAEAQLASKATTNANKLALDIGKVLQSKPANVTAKILDNTAQNYMIMGSPTMDAQRQKYLALGFSEEEANRRASGMTFLTNLALALPNTLRPNEMSIMDKVFNLGNFKEGAKAAVKQGVHFGVDMTSLRAAEEALDSQALRAKGIEVEEVPFEQQLTDKFTHATKDFAVGALMSMMGRMKYRQSDMQLAGVAEAFNNPEALNKSIQSSVKSGKVSKEDAVAFQTFLNTLKPEYDKAINETTADGKPKFAPAIAAKVAIERTKGKQAEQALQTLDNSVEKWKTYETDKDGKPIEKVIYRHSDGKMYDYEEPKIVRQKNNLLGAVMDARKSVAQLEQGQYVKGKLVSANQMKAIVEANSLNGKAKEGQLEAIEANAPFENVEFEVVEFAKQPEIAKIVEEIKASGEIPQEMPSTNDPILNEKGEVVEGRTQVAHAIVRGGGKITFMKPLSEEKATEAANIALGEKIGETQPITEGLEETDVIAINEMQDVYNKHLEANEGDFSGALKEAAKDATERQYTEQETKDMLKRMNGGDAISDAIADAAYRDANKQPIKIEDGTTTELGRTDGGSERQSEQSEGGTAIAEQSVVRAVEADKEGQEPEQPTEIVAEEAIATPTEEVVSEEMVVEPTEKVVEEPMPESEPKKEAQTPSGEMVERTLLSQRLKASNIVDSVKQYFNDYENSMREIDSHEKADLSAVRLIQDVGMDEAVRMAKDGEIQGAFQSAVLGAKWLEADNNRKAATTPEEIAKAEKEYNEILKYVGKTQEQMGGANSYWGTFYSRNENLGLTTADKIARWEAKAGKVASEEIREAYEKLDAENKENLAEIKRLREEAEKFQMQEIIDEIKDRAKTTKPKTETEEARRQRVSDKLFAIAERVRKSETSGLALSTPIPPHIISDSIKLLGQAAKGGEKIADAMLRVYELIENSIGKKLSDNEKSKVEKYFNDIVAESELPEIDTNEPLTTNLLKEMVMKGFDTPEKLLAKVKDFYPNKTDREVRDIITKYGQPLKETQTEIGQKVSAIKSIWAKISQLEDARSGKLPLRRSAPENKEFRDERRRKTNELREAMKNLDVPEAEMEDKWQTRIEASKKRYQNAISDMEKAIKDGEIIVKNEAVKLTDAEVNRLQKEYEKVKEFYDEAFGKKEKVQLESLDRAIDRVEDLISDADLEIKRKPKEQKTLAVLAKKEVYDNVKKELLKAREEVGIVEREQLRKRTEYLKKRIEYYEERQKKGDYSKKERKKSPINDEINKLLAKNDVLKFEEQKLIYLAEQQSKKKYEKRLDMIADIWNIPRIQMATGEFSFIGVQGRRLSTSYLLKNPKVLKEAVQKMLKSFASSEGLAEVMSEIKTNDPTLYHAMKASKLDITETSYKIAATEENTQRIGGAFLWKLISDLTIMPLGKAVTKVTGKDTFEEMMKIVKDKPLYENFERAAVGYNNFLRVKAFTDFNELMNIEGKNFDNSENEYKIFANYLNTATGRGKLSVLEPNAELLSKLLFSPRNFSSELQLATTPFGVGKLAAMQLNSDIPLRNFRQEQSAVKEALKHQLRYTALQMGLAATATYLLYQNLGSTDENEDGTGVELDPRSTKFGTATFKDGKTVDFFSGSLRYAILASRIGTQEYKTADKVKLFNDKAYVKKGEVKELGEGYIPDGLDLMMQIAANKVNPALGTAYTLYKAEPKTELDKAVGVRRDRFGNRVSVEKTIKELTAPIFWNGVVESAQNDPSIVDGLGQLAAFFAFAGYRVQNKEKLAREEQEQVKKDLIEVKKKRPKYRF